MDIVIADDHELLLDGLTRTLSELVPSATIYTAESGAKVKQYFSSLNKVHLVLLDLCMPDVIGVELLKEVCETWPNSHVAVLSASEDPKDIRNVKACGASGYITKSSGRSAILAALKIILKGGSYFPPVLLNNNLAVAKEIVEQEKPSTLEIIQKMSGLTPRQKDVLCMLTAGKCNKEIARDLNISNNTVKIHLAAIFKNINVNSRTQAVAFVVNHPNR